MKKLLLITLIVTFGATAAFAHCGKCGMEGDNAVAGEAKGMKDKMKAKMDSMFDGLNLTEEQKAKIEVLKETKHKAMKAAKDEFRAGMKEVLTPEQLKIFEGMHADHQHE